MIHRPCPRTLLLGSLAFLLATLTAPVQAGIIYYTDLATWQAAVGPVSFTEDFSGFTSDASFQALPVSANGFTIQQEGFDQAFRNTVDVLPLGFSGSNGTNGLSMYTNFVEGPTAATTARFTFAQANGAFGGHSTLGGVSEGAAIDIYNGATLLGSITLDNANESFRGYQLTGGDVATSVLFRSAGFVASSTGEGFYYDNIFAVNAVPEPSSALLLAGSGLGLLLRRRRTQG